MAVESINGKTGVVVLHATDVEAVPTSEVGQPSGVASLNGSGMLPEGQLPASVVSSSVRHVSPPSTASTEAEKATANTTAIQTAIDEGVGRVILREGTYICNLLELKTGVILEGRGINATTIKLRSGANTDLLHSENWETLKAGNTGGGISNGGFCNLTFDGNKANNTSPALVERSGNDGVTKASSKIFTSATAAFKASDAGGFLLGEKIAPGTTITVVKSATEVELNKEARGAGTGLKWTVIPPSSGLVSIYGKAYIAENFFVQNAAGHGFFSEWGNTGGSEMEAWVQNFKIINCEKSGLVWHGPHDSMINSGTVQGAGQYGVWTQGNAASEQFTNIHCWGESQKIAWCLEREALLLGCQGEGAKECDVLVGKNNTSIRGGQFFLSPIAIKLGIAGQEITGCHIDTSIFECSSTCLEIVGEDWLGYYELDVSPPEETTAAVYRGTLAGNSYFFARPRNESGALIQYPAKTVIGGNELMVVQNLVAHAASATAKVGELLKMTATATVTLPAASVNAIVGVICASGETTIKMTGAKIFGDFITGAESIKLLLNQHVILQSDGTNWYIIAGEPKRESKWSAIAERASGAEYTPSATREAEVVLSTPFAGEFEVFVGGVQIGYLFAKTEKAGESEGQSLSFRVGAGEKWKAVGLGNLKSSYRLL